MQLHGGAASAPAVGVYVLRSRRSGVGVGVGVCELAKDAHVILSPVAEAAYIGSGAADAGETFVSKEQTSESYSKLLCRTVYGLAAAVVAVLAILHSPQACSAPRRYVLAMSRRRLGVETCTGLLDWYPCIVCKAEHHRGCI